MVIEILKTFWKARKIMKRPKIKIGFYIYPGFWGFHSPSNPFISWSSYDVWWKDKYDTPRFEYPPSCSLILFGIFQIYLELHIPGKYNDYQYWEQLLWMSYYLPERDPERLLTEEDWEEGKKTWPWRTDKDGEKVSTWSDEFHV